MKKDSFARFMDALNKSDARPRLIVMGRDDYEALAKKADCVDDLYRPLLLGFPIEWRERQKGIEVL